MIAPFPEFFISRETDNVANTLQAIREFKPDVCILEVVMGKNAGLQFLKDVKALIGNVPVLVIGYRHEREFAIRAHRSGAAGYLTKDCTANQLIHALRTVAAHRCYISDTVREMFVERIADTRPIRLHDVLSDPDFDILYLLAQGVPTPRIAACCRLNETFVRKRKTKIMEVLGLRNDAEIIEYAVRRRLVDGPYHILPTDSPGIGIKDVAWLAGEESHKP